MKNAKEIVYRFLTLSPKNKTEVLRKFPKIKYNPVYDIEFLLDEIDTLGLEDDFINALREIDGPPRIIWEEVDKEDVKKSVVLLDLFTKTFCRYAADYERFDNLKFRCDECPFSLENGGCKVKIFKCKFAPDYKDFGAMGDF